MSQNSGRPAVAEHDLVAVGQGEQLGQPVAQLADREAHGGLAVAGAQVGGRTPLARALTASGRILDGPQPKRPSAGQQLGGDGDGGEVVGHRRHYRGRSVLRRNPFDPGRSVGPGTTSTSMTSERISRRVGAITESATLAVDARAKALKAAGEPVIGFGAGEPDFPTPDHIVEAAVAACRDPRNHRYSPAGGLPELKEAIAAKTLRDSGLEVLPGQVAGHQRRQARRLQHLRGAAEPRRRGAAAGPVLDHLPRAHRPGRRRGGGAAHRRGQRASGSPSTSSRRPARPPPRRWCSCRRPTPPARSTPPTRCAAIGALGRRARHLGHHRRDLRAPHLRRPPVHVDRHPGPRAGRPVRGAQRRGQDLRHDRLAGGLDDRPGRRDQGRHQPPVALHLQRGQRVPARRAGRGGRRPRGGGHDARRLRPPPAAPSTACSTRSPA